MLSNRNNDLILKKELYEKYKVKEYWIIDPLKEIIIQYILENNKYTLIETAEKNIETIKSIVLDFELNINDIFE